MRSPSPNQQIVVSSCSEIDALVGEIVMDETPMVRWEDSWSHFRFDTLDEALDVLGDPLLLGRNPEEHPSTVLAHVREFRPFSTDMLAAWEVVERLGAKPLQLRREGAEWIAAFGENAAATGDSAALVICLAALRACGCEVYMASHTNVIPLRKIA
ncbi:BC1872 family protein [Verrucomicrobiota bacterium sgz303538]